jgi:hypothetical protein
MTTTASRALTSSRSRASALILLLALLVAASARATTFQWTGVTSSDWNNQENWSPLGVPGANDDVVIESGHFQPLVGGSEVPIQSLLIYGLMELQIASGALLELRVSSSPQLTLKTGARIGGPGTVFFKVGIGAIDLREGSRTDAPVEIGLGQVTVDNPNSNRSFGSSVMIDAGAELTVASNTAIPVEGSIQVEGTLSGGAPTSPLDFSGPAFAPKHYEMIWDGRDEIGNRFDPGVYFVRFEAGAMRRTRRLIRVE